MFSDTTERLLIIHINSFLQKYFFFHVGNFTLIYDPYRYLIDNLFGPMLMENCVYFFKRLLIFLTHDLQLDLNFNLMLDCRAMPIMVYLAP